MSAARSQQADGTANPPDAAAVADPAGPLGEAGEPQEAGTVVQSPIWFGAVSSLAMLASVLWLLSYTLLDLGWQQRLGGWNYLIALLISMVSTRIMEKWRNNPRRSWDD